MKPAAACLVLLVCGCSGAGPETPPADPRVFYHRWYAVECEAANRCCGGSTDIEYCATTFAALFTGFSLTDTTAKIAAKQIAFVPEAGAACLAARRSAFAGCGPVQDGPYAACSAVFIGNVPVGGDCAIESCSDCPAPPWPVGECVPGAFCQVTGDPSIRSGHYPGSCQPQLPAGAMCATNSQCSTGLCTTVECVPGMCQPFCWMAPPPHWSC